MEDHVEILKPGDAIYYDSGREMCIRDRLTTVRVPNYDMGVAAAKRLLQRIEGKAAGDGETLLLGTELIVRGSTSPEGDNSWDLGSW